MTNQRTSTLDLHKIERQRDVIYRRTPSRRIRTMADAARWIDTVGFCYLFAPATRVELPSLFEAVKGRRDAHIQDWDADSDMVWGWKNDLPATRRAYYGKALTGKSIFISLKMLPMALAIAAPDEFKANYEHGRIRAESKRLADTLANIGPTPTMALRLASGLDNVRYHRALDELQRLLVVLPVGATNEHGAWPSQIFDLVTRWFPRQAERARKIDVDAAHRAIVRCYMRTVIAADVPTIVRTLGLSREHGTGAIDQLVARRILYRQDDWVLTNDDK